MFTKCPVQPARLLPCKQRESPEFVIDVCYHAERKEIVLYFHTQGKGKITEGDG